MANLHVFIAHPSDEVPFQTTLWVALRRRRERKSAAGRSTSSSKPGLSIILWYFPNLILQKSHSLGKMARGLGETRIAVVVT